MRQKILASFIYGATAVAFGRLFDGLYGGEPVTHRSALIYAATAGAFLFAIACILSFFTLRFAVGCALAASILSWPCFGIALFEIPWRKLISILPYSNWQDQLTAILALVVSSVYSAIRLRLLRRAPATGGMPRG